MFSIHTLSIKRLSNSSSLFCTDPAESSHDKLLLPPWIYLALSPRGLDQISPEQAVPGSHSRLHRRRLWTQFRCPQSWRQATSARPRSRECSCLVLASRPLWAWEAQDGREQDGGCSRCRSLALQVKVLPGVYILPQNWVFYKSLFGGVEFFMVRNANFGLNLVVFEQKIWVFFIKWTQFFKKSAKNGSFFYKYEYRNKRKNIHPWKGCTCPKLMFRKQIVYSWPPWSLGATACFEWWSRMHCAMYLVSQNKTVF